MSLHWHNLQLGEMEGARSIHEILEEIAAQDPDLADDLSGVDWVAIRRHVARQALEDAATHFGVTLADTFHNKSGYGEQSGEPPKGECVGVIGNEVFSQLGVSIESDGCLHFFWNTGSAQMSAHSLQAWKAYVQERFAHHQLITMGELLGDQTSSEVLPDGTLVVIALKEDA